jgi:hypothetical protein
MSYNRGDVAHRDPAKVLSSPEHPSAVGRELQAVLDFSSGHGFTGSRTEGGNLHIGRILACASSTDDQGTRCRSVGKHPLPYGHWLRSPRECHLRCDLQQVPVEAKVARRGTSAFSGHKRQRRAARPKGIANAH